jgi:hypothetical protein
MMPWTIVRGTPKVGGHSEASRTPSRPLVPAPDVEQPPAAPEAADDDIYRPRDSSFFAGDGGGDLVVLPVDNLDDAQRRADVDVRAGLVAFFGCQPGSILQHTCSRAFSRP